MATYDPQHPNEPTWWCTWCGKPHRPDHLPPPGMPELGSYAQPDPRYAMADCSGAKRVLITDEREASYQAHARGRYRKPGPILPKADQAKADQAKAP